MSDLWENSYTTVRFPRAPFSLSTIDRISFWGSCFAQELFRYYETYELPCTESPYGIIYNPLTMGKGLDMILDDKLTDLPFLHQNLWRHSAFHSSRCCRPSEEMSLDKARFHFETQIHKGLEDLSSSTYLVITLGTSWVYRRISNGCVVNNCHKEDGRLFERLPFDQCESWQLNSDNLLAKVITRLNNSYPNMNIIVTISPVRHLRNDARENGWSKARLRCLAEDLCRSFDFVHYFPAYEIMMDELRDYRWYAPDLSHPSEQAVEYIMARFVDWAGGKDLKEYLTHKKKELRRNRHRSFL